MCVPNVRAASEVSSAPIPSPQAMVPGKRVHLVEHAQSWRRRERRNWRCDVNAGAGVVAMLPVSGRQICVTRGVGWVGCPLITVASSASRHVDLARDRVDR